VGGALLGALALASGAAQAAPGDPVNSFNWQTAEVALQGGKTILAGTADNADLGLIRLSSDGSPDASFDVEGFVRADFGSSESAADMALTPAGKIVVAGTQDPGATPVAVLARFNSDGSPDTSFGGDGKATMALAAGDSVTSVDVSGTGRVGVGVTAGNGDFKVLALTAAGDPDAGFGSGGVATLSFGGTDQVTAVAFQSSGKLVAAGGTTKNGGEFAIARFGLNGVIDNAGGPGDVDPAISFNGAGAQEIDATAGTDRVLGMAIDSTDRIVLCGPTGSNGGFPVSGTVRLSADGAWDAAFAGDGKAEFPDGLLSQPAEDVAIAGTGDIVVSGTGYEASGFGYVQRLSTAGVESFASEDTGGSGAAYDTVAGVHVAAAADGGFTLGGQASEFVSPDDLPGGFAQRFTAANATDPTFAGDGTTFPRFTELAPPPPPPPPSTTTTTPTPVAAPVSPPAASKRRCKKAKKRHTASMAKKCKKRHRV
jgi:uncharacterized delta-60 repeat protein